MGSLLRCETGFLRKHKPFVPCSVSLSNNCDRKSLQQEHHGKHRSTVQKKVNLEVLVRFPFQGHPLLLGEEKSAKRTYFAARRCLINPSLIFATQSLIIHSILSFALVCLTKVCDYSVLPNVMKNLLLIARNILQRWFLLSPYS